jgi:hypothetical protein
MDWSFASSCSPPRLSTSQLLSATDSPVLLSDRDFHPTVGAHFQAHISGCSATASTMERCWRLFGRQPSEALEDNDIFGNAFSAVEIKME